MEQYLEFVANNTILIVALLASLFLVVFTEIRLSASGLSKVEPGQAVGLINQDAAVIDLRSAEVFGRGHIAGARNIPLDELDAKLDGFDRATPVVAVCDAGMSASKAVETLRRAGFESVWGIKGGMAAWDREGLPVVTGKKTRAKGSKGGKTKN